MISKFSKFLILLIAACAFSQAQNTQLPVTGTAPVPTANLVSASDRISWNAKQNALSATNPLPFSYLTGVPPFLTLQTLPTYPSKLSQFTNDPGFLTRTTLPAYPTKLSQLANDPGFLTLQTLPAYATKLSQFTNDVGLVNALQCAAGAPVQSVNGLIGAVSFAIPTKLSQLTNDIGFTTTGSQVPIPTLLSQLTNDIQAYTPATLPPYPVVPINVSAFANDAQYVTLAQVLAALPAPPAIPTNVSAFKNDAGYIQASGAPVQSVNGQKGAVTIPTGSSHTFVAAVSPSIHDNAVPVNAAIALAAAVNGDVYVPCGIGSYPQSTPFVISKNVGLIGEEGCTSFQGNSDFTPGVTDAYITYPGLGYTQATVTFSGGTCTTEPTGRAIIRDTEVISVYVSNPGSCTTMPTCTIAGDGTGAACLTLGWGQIEMAQQHVRSYGTRIKNITFYEPPVSGTMGIHFKTSVAVDSTPGSSGGASVDERIEKGDFEWLQFQGSNQYNPLDFYLEGDCMSCFFFEIGSNPSRGSSFGLGSYATTLLATGICGGIQGGEECGLIDSKVLELNGGGNRGGDIMAFQGRMVHSHMDTAYGNGDYGSGFPNTNTFAFYNTFYSIFNGISTEGGAGGPQALLLNSQGNIFTSFGFGTPQTAADGAPVRDGLSLIRSSGNTFTGHAGSLNSAINFPQQGVFSIRLDANSYKNKFLAWGADSGGVNDFSSMDPSNYVQWCNATSDCNSGTPYHTIGSPF